MSLDRERLPVSLSIIPHGLEAAEPIEPRGDSRPRLSGGAKLRTFPEKPVRAALDWTAGGGCPHVDSGDGHTSQTRIRKGDSILIMTPEALARTIEDFLAGARDAIVLDDGAAMF